LGYESPQNETPDIVVPQQKEVNMADMEDEIELSHLRHKETHLLRNFRTAPKNDIESVATQLQNLEECTYEKVDSTGTISKRVSKKVAAILNKNERSKQEKVEKKEVKEEESENESEDEEFGLKKVKSERDKRKERLKRQREAFQARTNPAKKYGFEEVPVEGAQEEGDEEQGYDSDDIAETVAIAKKMLRKKKKNEILDSSVSRYTFEDADLLPSWFKEDEAQHVRTQLPVTKEEVNAEKEKMKIVLAPKKEMEAMGRKKRKVMKKMDKVKSKANAISNQPDLTEQAKNRQIEKLYKKEMRELKPKKKYVVSKRFQSMRLQGANKKVKGIKMVDARMKKEVRAKVRKIRKQKRR
jgi:AdoMet-dependent rRNA methyltransferase SPB1